MKVIAGCVMVRNNKTLMVKEAKGSCYGQWNYPEDRREKVLEVNCDYIKNYTWKV